MNGFGSLPVVVKNLLIINVIVFVATRILFTNVDWDALLSLHYYKSDLFRPHQFITYMFMHAPLTGGGGIMHIFFNMFALYMFGRPLEMVWGPKRFLTFYLLTGIGAALVHLAYASYAYGQVEDMINTALQSHPNHPEALAAASDLHLLYDIPMMGASGSVFGVLAAFAMLFPNVELMLIFFPVPIKAKYFVLIYAAIEFFAGIRNAPGDNVAHFAHLGGALFGFILVKIWNRNRRNFY